MAETPKLAFAIEVDSAGAATALREIRGELEKLSGAGGRGEVTFSKIGARAIEANQALELLQKTARGVANIFEQTIGAVARRGDELVNMSRRFSVPVETLSTFSFAAQQAGVSVESLGGGFRSMAAALSDASRAGTAANQILTKSLGFTVAEIRKLQAADPVKAMLEIGQAFERFADSAQKSDQAATVFGRSFGAFLQIAKEGPDAFNRNIEAAKRFGLAMDDATAKAGNRFEAGLGAIRAALEGVRQRLFGNRDALDRFASLFETAADKIAAFGRSIPQDRVDSLLRSVTTLAESTGKIAGFFGALLVSESSTSGLRLTAAFLSDIATALERIKNAKSSADVVAALGSAEQTSTTFREAFQRTPVFGTPGFRDPVLDVLSGRGLRPVPPGTQVIGAGNRYVSTPTVDPLRVVSDPVTQALALPNQTFAPEPGSFLAFALSANGTAALPKPQIPPGPGKGTGNDQIENTRRKLQALRAEIEGLRDPTKAFNAEVEKMALEFKGAEAEARPLIRQLLTERAFATLRDDAADAKGELQALRDPTQRIAVEVEKAQRAMGLFDEKTRAWIEAGIRGKALTESWNFERDITRRLEDAIDPAAALRHEFEDLRRAALELGRADLLPLVDQLEQVEHAARAFASVFDAIEQTAADTFSGLILQTRDVADAFEGLKLSIIRSLTDAALTEVRTRLGKFVLSTISEQGGDSGILGTVLRGIGIGSTVTRGGFGNSAGLALADTGATFSTASPARSAPLGGGGLFDDPIGLGFKGIGAIQAGASLLSSAPALTSTAGGFGASAGSAIAGTGVAFDTAGVSGLQQGGSLLGTAGSLVTIIGALYSLYNSVQSTIEANKAFSKGTLGAPEATNFKVASGVGLGAGVGIGAGVGAAFGPIGAVAGAALGAAISTLIAQQVQQGVTKNVAGAGRAGAGITQSQFATEIKDDTTMRLLFGGSKLGTGGFASPLAPLPGVKASLLDLFIPSIDEIFRKLFAQRVEQLSGVQLNRGAKGSTAFPGLRDEAGVIAAIVGGGLGAGTSRTGEFGSILRGSLKEQGQSPQEAEETLRRVFRGVASESFAQGLRLITQFGPSPQSEKFDKFIATASGAFQKQAPLVDLKTVGQSLIDEKLLAPGKASVQARQITRNAFPQLFAGETPEAGRAAFTQQIFGQASEIFQGALGNAIFKGPVGEILTAGTSAFTRRGRKVARRFRRRGITPSTMAFAENQFAIATEQFADKLNATIPQIEAYISSQKKLNDTIFATQVRFTAESDPQQARQMLLGRLAPFIQARDETRAFNESIRQRVAVAQGDAFGGSVAQLGILRERRQAAESTFQDRVGVGGAVALLEGNAEALERLGLTLDETQQLFQTFATTRLDELEAELALARQLATVFRGLEQSFKAIKEQGQVALGTRTSSGVVTELVGKTKQDTAIGLTSQLQANRAIASSGSPAAPLFLADLERRGLSTEKLTEKLGQFQADLTQLITVASGRRDFFQGASETFGGVREQVDVLRRGPRAIDDIIGKRRARIEELLPQAIGENPDEKAVAEISRLLPELLGLAQQQYGPGSPQMEALLTFTDTVAGQVKTSADVQVEKLEGILTKATDTAAILEAAFGKAANSEDLRVQSITTAIGDFYAKWRGTMSFLELYREQRVAEEFKKLRELIGSTGGESLQFILAGIAKTIKAPGKAEGGPVTAGQPVWVGERGVPELFVPRQSGTIVPLHKMGTGDASRTVNVKMGDVQVVVQGAQKNAEQLAREVADIMRRRTVPELVDEVRRAVG